MKDVIMKLLQIAALALLMHAPFTHTMDECRASIIGTGLGVLGTAGMAMVRHRAQKTVAEETARIQRSYDEERAENDPEESMLQDVSRPLAVINNEERRKVHAHTHWDSNDITLYTKLSVVCCCFTLWSAYDITQTCSSQK